MKRKALDEAAARFFPSVFLFFLSTSLTSDLLLPLLPQPRSPKHTHARTNTHKHAKTTKKTDEETAPTSPSSSSSSPPVAPDNFEESDPARTPFHLRLARAARARDPDAAESVLRDMASAGLLPGPRAVHACVVAAAAAGDADGALDAMRRAHAAGLRPLPESYVALIHAFAGVGDAAAARAVLASMARAVPDAREGWLALCASLFRAGLGADAEAALLRGRRADGWQPDAEVYHEWMLWLCSTRGATGVKVAQFVFQSDMRAAGVEPDVRHANTLLAADAALLSPDVGERTLFAMSQGDFGALCKPNADSHAIVMEAHLELLESAARRAAPRLSGPDKGVRMMLESAHAAATGNASPANPPEADPVAAIFASDPSNFTQRGLDEGGDGVGAGHEYLDEALGQMLDRGVAPNKRVLAAMTRATLVGGGGGAALVMTYFRDMARLGRPGTRTEHLPDETMAALVAFLSEGSRPWDLLDVVAAAADDRRQLPEEVFGPRGLDAERLYFAEEIADAEAAAAAEAEEEDEFEFFGEGEEERKQWRQRQEQKNHLLPRPPSLSAAAFLSPIADWIPKALAGATPNRVPGHRLVDFKAATARAEEEALAASASSSSSSPSREGVLIETLPDAQGGGQRRVSLSEGNAGSGSACSEGGSRHWVDADGAVVALPGEVGSDIAAAAAYRATASCDVGPGLAATVVPISKMDRDQLVAELAARGLPFGPGMRKGEQYEAVKAARAIDRAGLGGASDLDDVVLRRERAELAAAAREFAKIKAAADEAAEAAVADVYWHYEVWEDHELVERGLRLAPPPGAEGAGDPDWKSRDRIATSVLDDDEEEEELTEAEREEKEWLAGVPQVYSTKGEDLEEFMEMTDKEVMEQTIARLVSGEPDEDPALNLRDAYGRTRDELLKEQPPFWPVGTPRVSGVALRLLEAAEACGASATAADLAALASAAAADGGDPDLALAVARRLGNGELLREALSAPVVEAVGADLRRATRVLGGREGTGGEDPSSARAAVEAALAAAGIGSAASSHPPSASSLITAGASLESLAEGLSEDDEEEDEARAREEAEAEAVAAAIARAAAERAASPAPRLGGEVVSSSSSSSSPDVASVSASAVAPAAGRKVTSAADASAVASSSSLSIDEDEEEEEEEEDGVDDDESEDEEGEEGEGGEVAAVAEEPLGDDEEFDEEGGEREADDDDDERFVEDE